MNSKSEYENKKEEYTQYKKYIQKYHPESLLYDEE
jgi:hypothetical protein